MIGIAVYLAFLLRAPGAPEHDLAGLLFVYCLSFGIGIYCLLDIFDTFRFQLILVNDAIAVRRAWGTRQLARTDIASWSEEPRPYRLSYRRIILRPHKDTRLRALRVPLIFKVDEAFAKWLAELPSGGRL